MTKENEKPGNAGENNGLDPVLDPKQLRRIEGVHRGFLYQHLYAVYLLLRMIGTDVSSVAVERDEDVEIRQPGVTTYIQIKTRQESLTPGDVQDVLTRFGEIREAHANGEREGGARFAIVSNANPSASLATKIEGKEWPADVNLATPAHVLEGLPTPPLSIDDALRQCEAAATEIPFGGLAPATLVLKLATITQHAATGARDHTITAEDLPGLLEQLVQQLQDFPEPPRPYHPQRDEPAILAEERVRIIVGFSGAGKTAWAAEAARHQPEPIAYFDVGGLPAPSIASNLAREIVARFLGAQERSAQLPATGGLDMLRAADAMLSEQGTTVLIVLDNGHKLSADELRSFVEAAPHNSFLVLAQPWPDRALVESLLGIEVEALLGYDTDGVAAVFAGEGVGIDVPTGENILRLTGGLPLYVANAATLTAKLYDGDARAFCSAIERRTHEQDIAQDLILEASFDALSSAAKDAAALLGIADVPLSTEESSALLEDLGAQRAAAIRSLRRASMVVAYPNGLGLHDALRPLAAGHGQTLPAERVDAAYERLHKILILSLLRNRSVPRLTLLVRLLPRVGRTDALVDLATSEMFYEQGNMAAMWETLEAASKDETASAHDRFWALDAVAYWQSRDGGTPSAEVVDQMAKLVDQNPEFVLREHLNLLFKQLVIAGSAGDRKEIERLSAKGRKLTHDQPFESRLFRYNRAIALYRTGALAAVRGTIEALIDEWFKVLGFSEIQLIGANGKALLELLSKVHDREDVKRTADALALWATVVMKQGDFPGLRRIQAMKLFASAGAGRSAAVMGQEGADEMLRLTGDAVGARQLMEDHVLPLIEQYGLSDLALEARGEYAVILAYCRDFEGADRQIAAIANYEGNAEQLEAFELQAALVSGIKRGLIGIERRQPRRAGMRYVLEPNRIGKDRKPDDLCDCGSGRKYKRCHGRK
ncbi:MAG: hypothetical protein QOH81_3235 [Sphingomonadales bacterium]|nr:hypothetical protein [Sphingomonadales bacterium]